MRFVKMQGTGNDFVVVDGRRRQRDWSRLAVAVCHRHFGVGADGLLVLQASAGADYKMRMFNPDGSEAEACGNGLRCLARYVTDVLQPGCAPDIIVLETLAGVRPVRPIVKGGRIDEFQVNMGRPQFGPDLIPVDLAAGQGQLDITHLEDYPLHVDGADLKVTCVSMGNPHCVSFIQSPVADFPLLQVGPLVEHHALFPKRTNFEVVRAVEPGRLEARVWERGAGETLACGSGACAIGVAWRLGHPSTLRQAQGDAGSGHGTSADSVEVALPGGVLKVDWDGKGDVLLTGPAEIVFHGNWPEPPFDKLRASR